jgi:hypothetical protein
LSTQWHGKFNDFFPISHVGDWGRDDLQLELLVFWFSVGARRVVGVVVSWLMKERELKSPKEAFWAFYGFLKLLDFFEAFRCFSRAFKSFKVFTVSSGSLKTFFEGFRRFKVLFKSFQKLNDAFRELLKLQYALKELSKASRCFPQASIWLSII